MRIVFLVIGVAILILGAFILTYQSSFNEPYIVTEANERISVSTNLNQASFASWKVFIPEVEQMTSIGSNWICLPLILCRLKYMHFILLVAHTISL